MKKFGIVLLAFSFVCVITSCNKQEEPIRNQQFPYHPSYVQLEPTQEPIDSWDLDVESVKPLPVPYPDKPAIDEQLKPEPEKQNLQEHDVIVKRYKSQLDRWYCISCRYYLKEWIHLGGTRFNGTCPSCRSTYTISVR